MQIVDILFFSRGSFNIFLSVLKEGKDEVVVCFCTYHDKLIMKMFELSG